MQHTKRTFLAGIATTVAVGASATSVLGQSDYAVACSEIAYEDEYVVFANNGESTADVSGFTVAFEYSSDIDQRRDLPDGTTIDAGARLIVATGAKPVEDADVTFDYEGEVLNNSGDDVVALLDTDGNEVCTIGGQSTETETATEEPTETETETDESTSTETETTTETETETAEPTETESETETETATEDSDDDGDDDC